MTWRRCLVAGVCGVVLGSGVLVYGQQPPTAFYSSRVGVLPNGVTFQAKALTVEGDTFRLRDHVLMRVRGSVVSADNADVVRYPDGSVTVTFSGTVTMNIPNN